MPDLAGFSFAVGAKLTRNLAPAGDALGAPRKPAPAAIGCVGEQRLLGPVIYRPLIPIQYVNREDCLDPGSESGWIMLEVPPGRCRAGLR